MKRTVRAKRTSAGFTTELILETVVDQKYSWFKKKHLAEVMFNAGSVSGGVDMTPAQVRRLGTAALEIADELDRRILEDA
jgi:hypothetical protein